MDTDLRERFDMFNQGLESLCEEEGCNFINQDHSFRLHNGEVNMGLLDEDGLHLNPQGSLTLVQNMGVDLKPRITSVVAQTIRQNAWHVKTGKNRGKSVPHKNRQARGQYKKPQNHGVKKDNPKVPSVTKTICNGTY